MMIRNRLKQAEVAVFRSMSDAELEAIAAGLDPAIAQAIRALSNAELQAVIDGTATPALMRKIRGQRQ